MENSELLDAWDQMGSWLMGHPNYAFGVNATDTAFRILFDGSEVDTEPFTSKDLKDKARAIRALLERR